MKLSDELKWRGLINQTTYKDLSIIDNEPTSFYFGVDPSADSMTIGNLAVIMLARILIKHGYKAYVLVGGATGMIGDPDGKKDERNLKTLDEISNNKNKIKQQYLSLFKGLDCEFVDNFDWFKSFNYLDFLRIIGKHVPLSQMLGREFVKDRLNSDGSGISYAEFSYVLIQAYDFYHLFKEYGVTLQVCGADQWGNVTAGIDLVRRLAGKEANGYSIPLIINKTTGVKFGKSEAGAVWLDKTKTSVYKFYQFWLNADDAGVADYLKIYTDLNKDEIASIMTKQIANPGERIAQKALARSVTTLVHGAEACDSVEKVTDALFNESDVSNLSLADIDLLENEINSCERGKLIDILVKTNLANSRNSARQLIKSGAIKFNNQKIIDPEKTIDNFGIIKKGKNSFILIK